MYIKKQDSDKKFGVFSRVKKIILRKDVVFENIKIKPNIFKGVIVLILIFIGVYLSQISLLREFILEKLKEDPQKYARITDDMINKEIYSNIVIGVFSAFANPFFKSFFVYALIRIFNKKVKLKTVISLFVYSYFIIAIGQIAASILRNFTGNIYANFSIAMVLNKIDLGSYVYTFASHFDIFTILYLYITIRGVKLINEISYKNASYIVLTPTIMYLFTILISIFQ